jgi:hypothetical protein
MFFPAQISPASLSCQDNYKSTGKMEMTIVRHQPEAGQWGRGVKEQDRQIPSEKGNFHHEVNHGLR